eukprot:ANDGO_04849.mRNA.1 Olivetolic acid cyclase
MTIEHVVMWRLRSDVTDAEVLELREAIEAMNGGVIPGVRDVVFRKSISGRAKGFDYVLRCFMESKEDLDAYAVHPLHVRVKDIVAKLREDLLCIDIEL